MAKTIPATIEAIAPGKIIFSGEYAVLYDNPALAMAINRFCSATFSALPSSKSAVPTITFAFKDLNYQHQFTLSELLPIAEQVMIHGQSGQSYAKSAEVLSKIRAMIAQPYFLGVYAFAFLAEKLHLKEIMDENLRCEVASELPVGSGVGSSAALIMSMLHGLLNYFSLPALPATTALAWGREIESIQHDHSSGMDLYLAHHGGGIKFQKGTVEPRPLFEWPFMLVNTGKPQATTGECVREVKKNIAHPHLLKDLSAITLAIDDAWQKSDLKAMCAGIYANHALLKLLGVVPAKVALFIEELHKLGFAAKVSGAGSVRGDNAGMVLVIGDGRIEAMLKKYSYKVLTVSGEKDGVRIL